MSNWFDYLLGNEPVIRISIFVIVLTVMMGWEAIAPRRRLSIGRVARWPSNLGIAALNTIVLRLALPIVPVAFAVYTVDHHWGLFPALGVPGWVAVFGSILLLDLLIWAQHLVVHKVPVLWRLHRMHHADQDYDVTTGARFHPLEILFSGIIKLAAIAALGAPPVAVLVFEVLLNATAMFNHGNVSLPAPIDRIIRLLVVTPDMHRVHHSWHRDETDSNYGFSFPWWDRLFGTYRPQPRDGHDAMTIGLEAFRTRKDQRLDSMLLQPFRRTKP